MTCTEHTIEFIYALHRILVATGILRWRNAGRFGHGNLVVEVILFVCPKSGKFLSRNGKEQ
ncbi:unnamed protein product [Camellia sinensis]